jgi:YbbR domain-containing protein
LAPQAYYQLAPAITITEATTTGINQLSNVVNSFNAYPSLMNDQVTVAFDLKEASAASLTLVSMQGQTVKTLISQEPLSVGNVKRTFDVSGLAQGIYLLRLQIGAGSEVTKLVKQ